MQIAGLHRNGGTVVIQARYMYRDEAAARINKLFMGDGLAVGDQLVEFIQIQGLGAVRTLLQVIDQINLDQCAMVCFSKTELKLA